MTKRKSGTRRRGTITKTKSGGFQARFSLPKNNVTGARPTHAKTFDTKDEAAHWLTDEWGRHTRGGRVGRGSTQTLAEFLREFYASIKKATKGDGVLSDATCIADLELLELYLMKRAPGLADTPLDKLTTAPLREHFKSLSAVQSNGKQLAAATVSRVARCLRARLAYAKAEGLMRINPMDDGRIPVSGKKKRKRVTLSTEQAAALFAVCPESRVGAYVATLLWIGCRPSEGSGLTRDCLDLEELELTIRQAIVRTKPTAGDKGQGTSWTLGTTKTGTERKVPITPALAAMLRRHLAEQARERFAAGPEYQDNGLVFAGTFGTPYHLDSISSKYLKPLLRRAALHLAGETPLALPPATRSKAYLAAVEARRAQEDAAIVQTGFPMGIGLYSLRHSLASRLDQLRVPIKDIQEILGHADVSTTLGYIHGSAERRREAISALEDAILPKGKLGIA